MPRLPLLLVIALAACATSPPSARPIERSEVEALLRTQSDAWNRGDMDAFMTTYWESPELTFVGSSGLTRGHAETLARYRTVYPDAAARGVLTFALLEFRTLRSADAAVAIGRWNLDRTEPATGVFSLVIERRPEGLRIVHDHSSAVD